MLVTVFPELNTSTTCSQSTREGTPSSRVPASRAITSASVDEWETAPCFLANQVSGTKVRGPTKKRKHPPVLLESWRSPAKLASLNNASLH